MKTLTKEQIIEILWRWVFNKTAKHPKIRFSDVKDIASELSDSEPAEVRTAEENQYDKSLRLLKQFLDETPKEEIAKIIKQFDDMNIEGPTIENISIQ